MHTSFCFLPKAYSQISKGFNSWWLWRSGHLHTRQYITCGRPFLWETWSLPSKLLAIVTHFAGWLGLDSAFSNSSIAPFFFFNFFTRDSIAFSAHFSSSSPCFHPKRRLTAGEANANKDAMSVSPILREVAKFISKKCIRSNKEMRKYWQRYNNIWITVQIFP